MLNSSENSGLSFVAAKPWSLPWPKVLDKLSVSQEHGLSGTEVEARRRRYGANRLRAAKKRSEWAILVDQLKSLMVALLTVAGALSFVLGEWTDGVAIALVVAVNTAIGFFTELKAVRSMEALRQMSRTITRVRRARRLQELPAEQLVPGDIVVLEGGDVVSADLRLIEASKLQADESTLTGESLPVSKQRESLRDNVPLADRSNMLFKGTAVTRGSGEGVVVGTGMNTELGQISALVEEAEEEITPLERRLNKLTGKLVWVTLVVVVAVGASGILAGRDMFLMIETAIALAVAALPEGLPIVATIALARGMWRMAKRNALVNRLSAVETLGATSVICTDKTGTLTENQMTVTHMVPFQGDISVSGEGLSTQGEFYRDGSPVDPSGESVLRKALEVSVLCNNASLTKKEDGKASGVGEPMEMALLVAGAKAGMTRDGLLEHKPEVREEAFDPEVKMMATFHQDNGHYLVAVKGAPESVLDACSTVLSEAGEHKMGHAEREVLLERSYRMAEEGLRVLALAEKTESNSCAAPYQDLHFLSLVGLEDPPRKDVKEAIESCKDAGIRVVMVTGDQALTACSIAVSVGLIKKEDAETLEGTELKDPVELTVEERERLLKTSIFARVTPKQKLHLVELHQKSGAVVAMTGDGVNDAPALKKADIGVAMGQRGTQVAREASDMVLKDDAFATIVVAVRQGRAIFQNIRMFVFYLLSCNVSEIMAVALASVARVPLPVLPIQILFLNLVTDVFPALALGAGAGDPTVMDRPPREADEPILLRRHWFAIAGYGFVLTMAVLAALGLALLWLEMPEEQAVTVSFLTLAFGQLWHVFNTRSAGSGLFRNGVTRNPYVWCALALCTGLLLAATYVPGLADALKVRSPGLSGWAVIGGMSFVPLIVGQTVKSVTGS